MWVNWSVLNWAHWILFKDRKMFYKVKKAYWSLWYKGIFWKVTVQHYYPILLFGKLLTSICLRWPLHSTGVGVLTLTKLKIHKLCSLPLKQRSCWMTHPGMRGWNSLVESRPQPQFFWFHIWSLVEHNFLPHVKMCKMNIRKSRVLVITRSNGAPSVVGVGTGWVLSIDNTNQVNS